MAAFAAKPRAGDDGSAAVGAELDLRLRLVCQRQFLIRRGIGEEEPVDVLSVLA